MTSCQGSRCHERPLSAEPTEAAKQGQPPEQAQSMQATKPAYYAH